MPEKITKKEKYGIALWLIVFFSVLLWSGIKPHDYFTWLLEVTPALLGLIILAATYKKFKFTPLVYWLILVHCLILMVGGHYTYAEVPLFDWLREVFGWERNNYDKIGHFMQGFVPVIIIRELFIRLDIVKKKKWMPFIIISICLALSVAYEFVEWFVAVGTGTAADSFLGTQGYVWDTQSDMLLCLIGSITALIMLSRAHDKQIKKIKAN